MTPPTRFDDCIANTDEICALLYDPCLVDEIGASSGRCVAQRIKIYMIASGNHTTIYMTPPYKMHF